MIQNAELKQQARERIASATQEKKIILFYAGSLCAMSVIFMLADLLIARMMPQTGGLSTIGLRSFFSTLSSILPLISFLLSMCLGFGYLGGMVRISRGQYASPNVLRTGFERFWPLLRLVILKGLIFLFVSMAASYLSIFLFTLSPFSDRFLAIAEPMLTGGSLLNEGTLTMDETMMNSLLSASTPLMIIFLAAMVLLVVPMYYRLRLTNYILYDHPEAGARFAIRESKKMMRTHRLEFFKLDLSFWWFYLALAACYLLAYGDLFLALAGISLPVSSNIVSIVFFLLSCGVELALCFRLRNQVEVTYALAYNSLKPKDSTTGAVLGNIFQM